VPRELDVHLVMDNYATHKTPLIRKWLAKRPRWHVHLTPTSSSWLNQVERFFALLTDKKIRRGVYRSVAALGADIASFIERHNADPKPFRWTKSADDILASIERFCRYNARKKTRPDVANFSFRTLALVRRTLRAGVADRIECTVERKAVKRAAMFPVGRQITAASAAILIVAALGVGWRYWSLTNQSKRLDEEISAAQQETARLHSVILQVQQYEQRRAQLQQRVALIEELRRGQTGPVHMLDQVSRALPPMLWLTSLRQLGPDGAVLIEGRATTQTTVSDFVNNLEATGYFKKSIDIVNTVAEPIPGPPGELVKFTLRALFQTPADAKAMAVANVAPK